MKISTTTGLLQKNGNSDKINDLNDIVRRLSEVGYEELDLGFCLHNHSAYILRGDDWEKKIDELGKTAEECGVKFYQCHLPFVIGCSPFLCPDFKTPGYAEYFDECTRRAYIAAGKLGVRWAVAHPRTYPELNLESKASFEENHKWQDKFVELGIKNGVGTAFENMMPPQAGQLGNTKLISRFCQFYDQLIEYVDSYNDPMVGICWDTGHANQMHFDQARALRAIGNRLTTLHINDNILGDEHLLPYMGNIDWPSIINALVEIDYKGTLNYEAHKIGWYSWGDTQTDFAKVSHANGLYLLGCYEKALKAKQASGKSE